MLENLKLIVENRTVAPPAYAGGQLTLEKASRERVRNDAGEHAAGHAIACAIKARIVS